MTSPLPFGPLGLPLPLLVPEFTFELQPIPLPPTLDSFLFQKVDPISPLVATGDATGMNVDTTDLTVWYGPDNAL